MIRNLRPVLGVKKMGHAGTLDPMASGLLIVLLGTACKQQDSFMELKKTYEAEVTLGATSDTDDGEGEIEVRGGKTGVVEAPSKVRAEKALRSFIGEIEQIPPKHSAIKVDGRRAYSRARGGEEVVLNSRSVTVYDIYDVEYDYPCLQFSCEVSKGTYIRSLARDVGDNLGVGGYLSRLRRTQIGEFSVNDSCSPTDSVTVLQDNIQPLE